MPKIIIEGKEIEISQESFNALKESLIKPVTYEDIQKKLFLYKQCYCVNSIGDIFDVFYCAQEEIGNNMFVSRKQAERVLAQIKLQNVAYYLNGGEFVPEIYTQRYMLTTYGEAELIRIGSLSTTDTTEIYFKTEALAEQAIEILGEDTIRLALSHDF